MEHRILSGAPGYRDSWADDHAEGDFRAFAALRTVAALSQVLNGLDADLADELSGDVDLPEDGSGPKADLGH
jgi:hypothetical protein